MVPSMVSTKTSCAPWCWCPSSLPSGLPPKAATSSVRFLKLGPRLRRVCLRLGQRRVRDVADGVDGHLDRVCRGRERDVVRVHLFLPPVTTGEPARSRAHEAPGSTDAVGDGGRSDQPQRDWFWFSVDW